MLKLIVEDQVLFINYYDSTIFFNQSYTAHKS
jgi:hypothetical protein